MPWHSGYSERWMSSASGVSRTNFRSSLLSARLPSSEWWAQSQAGDPSSFIAWFGYHIACILSWIAINVSLSGNTFNKSAKLCYGVGQLKRDQLEATMLIMGQFLSMLIEAILTESGLPHPESLLMWCPPPAATRESMLPPEVQGLAFILLPYANHS